VRPSPSVGPTDGGDGPPGQAATAVASATLGSMGLFRGLGAIVAGLLGTVAGLLAGVVGLLRGVLTGVGRLVRRLV
jgi:hypothetical protein